MVVIHRNSRIGPDTTTEFLKIDFGRRHVQVVVGDADSLSLYARMGNAGVGTDSTQSPLLTVAVGPMTSVGRGNCGTCCGRCGTVCLYLAGRNPGRCIEQGEGLVKVLHWGADGNVTVAVPVSTRRSGDRSTTQLVTPIINPQIFAIIFHPSGSVPTPESPEKRYPHACIFRSISCQQWRNQK